LPYVTRGSHVFCTIGQYIIDNLSKLKAADIATFSEILARNHAKPGYEFHRTSLDVPFWTAIGDKHFLEWYQKDNFLHLTIRDMQRITKALGMRFHNKLTSVISGIDTHSTPSGKLIHIFDMAFGKLYRLEYGEDTVEDLDDLDDLFDAMHYLGHAARLQLLSRHVSFICTKVHENLHKIQEAPYSKRHSPLTSLLTCYTECFQFPNIDYSSKFADEICKSLIPPKDAFLSKDHLMNIIGPVTTLPHYTPAVVNLLEALHERTMASDYLNRRLAWSVEIMPELNHLRGKHLKPEVTRKNLEKPSQMEIIMAQALSTLDYKFEMGVMLKNGQTVDFYLPKQDLVIELDGPTHHLRRSGGICNSWTRHKQRLLETSGFSCIRVDSKKIQERWNVFVSYLDNLIKMHRPKKARHMHWKQIKNEPN